MELGHIPIQILVSIGLLICGVIAAVLFDLIKRKNDQLREALVDLQARYSEVTRREQMLPAAPAASIAAPAAAQSRKESLRKESPRKEMPAALAAPRKAQTVRTRVLSSDAQAAIERGMQMAGASQPSLRHSRAKAAVKTADVQAAPNVTQKADLAVAPAVKLHLVAANGKTCWAEAENLKPVERRAPYRGLKLTSKPVKLEQMNMKTSPVDRVIPARGSKKDWGALLKTRQSHLRADEAVPAGFHDGMVLSQLLKSRQPLNGVVVSIGVSGEVTGQVHEMVKSLLGPTDFGCQSGLDEFLLIYPKLSGAAAQRKLSSVAQQLWNFQLQHLEQASILFSWGGVEAHSELAENAIANANERMQETRRSRNNVVTMKPRNEAPSFQLAHAV